MELKYLLRRKARTEQPIREKNKMAQFVMLLKGSLIGVFRGSIAFCMEEIARGSHRVGTLDQQLKS